MASIAGTAIFMDSLGRMATPIDKAEGSHIFTTRSETVCIARVRPSGGSCVDILALEGVGDVAHGCAVAVGALCFLADLFNVTLVAEDSVVQRHVAKSPDDRGLLGRFGFMSASGRAVSVRLPMTLRNGRPGW